MIEMKTISKKIKWLQVSLASALGGAVICSIFSLLFYFGEWERLILVTSIGIFIGLVAAPEFDKKAFRAPILFQMVCGALAGLIIGIAFLTNIDEMVRAPIVGGLLGWLAPCWIKHILIP